MLNSNASSFLDSWLLLVPSGLSLLILAFLLLLLLTFLDLLDFIPAELLLDEFCFWNWLRPLFLSGFVERIPLSPLDSLPAEELFSFESCF